MGSAQSDAEWAEDDREQELDDLKAYSRVLSVIEEMEEHCPVGTMGWFYGMKLRAAVDGRQ